MNRANNLKFANMANSQKLERAQGITVGITPYSLNRKTKYTKWNWKFDRASIQNNTKAISQLMTDMNSQISAMLVQIVPQSKFRIHNAIGVWEGKNEPSFIIDFDELSDNNIKAIAKLGMEFSQDEVHCWSKDIDKSTRPLVLQEDGSFSTPYVILSFKDEVPYKEITSGGYGIKGATILEGNKLLMYQSVLPVESGKNALKQTHDFMSSIFKIVKAYESSIRAMEKGYTQLWRYTREKREGISTSYEQVLSNIPIAVKQSRYA
jgi:hypothetical protein